MKIFSLIAVLGLLEQPATVSAINLAASSSPKWKKLPFTAGNHLGEAFFRVTQWTA